MFLTQFAKRRSLLLLLARFGTPPTPDTEYEVVRVP